MTTGGRKEGPGERYCMRSSYLIPLQVKVMPGTAKKGKATKTALSMFIAERGTSQREKELLKSVKDVDLARGKIQ